MIQAWLDQFACHAAELQFPAGVTLQTQGSVVRELYAVKSGLIKLTCVNANGQETILGLRSSGYLCGGTSAMLDEPTLAAAVTATPCALFRLPVPLFLELLQKDASFAALWQQLQSIDNQYQLQLDILLRCVDAQKRLEHMLWQLAVTQSQGTQNIKIHLPLQNQEFAELLAITPAYLARCITKLANEGKLQRKQGWLIISSLDCLWHAQQWNDSLAPANLPDRYRPTADNEQKWQQQIDHGNAALKGRNNEVKRPFRNNFLI